MKIKRLFSLLLCLFLLVQLNIHPASAQDGSQYTGGNVPVSSGCHTIDAQKPLLGSEKMLKTAGAVLVYEMNSDTLVYAYNPDMRIEPASLVKIMTALVAIENGNLEDTVLVTSNAIAPIPDYAATLQLQAGEEFTLNDLMYCLLVGSANDAANVIAEHISGSVRAFVAEMNIRARELGCTDTNFVNAHGLNAENQYSTARDLAKILRAALEYDVFKEYFSALEYWVPETKFSKSRYLASTNLMMKPGISQIYYDSRITGGRTGVTNSRERSLVTTAESRGLCYINVVLNCVPTFDTDDYSVLRFGSYEETGDLLDIIFDGMRVTQVLSDHQIISQFDVQNGANAVAVSPSLCALTVLPSNIKMEDLTYQYVDTRGTPTAPISEGDYLGTIQVWYGSVCLAQSPVIANHDVRVADARNGLSQEEMAGDAWITGLTVLAVLVSVVVVAACVLYFVRSYQIMQQHKTRRKRSKNRRRS